MPTISLIELNDISHVSFLDDRTARTLRPCIETLHAKFVGDTGWHRYCSSPSYGTKNLRLQRISTGELSDLSEGRSVGERDDYSPRCRRDGRRGLPTELWASAGDGSNSAHMRVLRAAY